MLNIFEKGKNVFICWLVFLAWGIYLFNFSYYPKLKLLNSNKDLPEEMFGFTAKYFYNFLETIGESGQPLYFNFQIFDYLNGFLLGLTIFASIYYFLHKIEAHKFFKLVLILPVLLVIFDIAENSVFLHLISNFPDKLSSLVEIAGLLTKLKLIVGSFAFLTFVVTGLALTINLFLKRIKK